jgi:hypothetical protein
VLVLWEVDSAFSAGGCLNALLGPDRVRPGRPATTPKASLVAAPVRSAAPDRRHQSLMSDLDHPEAGLTGRDLRCEKFLYWRLSMSSGEEFLYLRSRRRGL